MVLPPRVRGTEAPALKAAINRRLHKATAFTAFKPAFRDCIRAVRRQLPRRFNRVKIQNTHAFPVSGACNGGGGSVLRASRQGTPLLKILPSRPPILTLDGKSQVPVCHENPLGFRAGFICVHSPNHHRTRGCERLDPAAIISQRDPEIPPAFRFSDRRNNAINAPLRSRPTRRLQNHPLRPLRLFCPLSTLNACWRDTPGNHKKTSFFLQQNPFFREETPRENNNTTNRHNNTTST
jgi:hypothetical protein